MCRKTYKRAQDLKVHRTKTGHFEAKETKITQTSTTDTILQKRKDMQDTPVKDAVREEKSE